MREPCWVCVCVTECVSPLNFVHYNPVSQTWRKFLARLFFILLHLRLNRRQRGLSQNLHRTVTNTYGSDVQVLRQFFGGNKIEFFSHNVSLPLILIQPFQCYSPHNTMDNINRIICNENQIPGEKRELIREHFKTCSTQ